MRAPRRGRVWHGERLVGHVREDEESHICFTYDRDWLDGGGFQISVSLPLWYGEDELKAHAWFVGLLPEGAARDRVRLRTGLQREKDDMGLLLRIGGDCAGALSVLPDGMTPAEAAEPILVSHGLRRRAAAHLDTQATGQGPGRVYQYSRPPARRAAEPHTAHQRLGGTAGLLPRVTSRVAGAGQGAGPGRVPCGQDHAGAAKGHRTRILTRE